MRPKPNHRLKGLSLTELIVAMAIAAIVVLSLGAVLVDNLRGFTQMYGRVYGDVVTDAYTSQGVFSRIVRKATSQRYVYKTGSLTVYYYAGPGSTMPDRYATFSVTDSTLTLREGTYDWAAKTEGDTASTETLATTVTGANFYVLGASVQMVLTLENTNNTKNTLTLTCSDMRHNP